MLFSIDEALTKKKGAISLFCSYLELLEFGPAPTESCTHGCHCTISQTGQSGPITVHTRDIRSELDDRLQEKYILLGTSRYSFFFFFRVQLLGFVKVRVVDDHATDRSESFLQAGDQLLPLRHIAGILF